MSIVRVANGHIIRVTCQVACLFRCLDAHVYSLCRKAFLGFFSHSFLKAIQPLRLLYTLSLLLCFLHHLWQFLLGQSLLLSHCFIVVSRLVFLCVAMCWIALSFRIAFLLYLMCLILNVLGYCCVFVQISSVKIIIGFQRRVLSLLCLDSTSQLSFGLSGFVFYLVWGRQNLFISLVGQDFTILTSLRFANTGVYMTLFHLSWTKDESLPQMASHSKMKIRLLDLGALEQTVLWTS